MKFIAQKISNVFIIEHNLFEDSRGVFRRSFCEREFMEQGINFNVRQGNISENPKAKTLRGFHYQEYPNGESKIMTCINGEIFNVIIDLRKDSPTFQNWISINISSRQKQSLYIPKGCANAFMTLVDNTIVHYYMSEFFDQDSYKGIRYNDPFFAIEWPFIPEIISKKDASFKDYKA